MSSMRHVGDSSQFTPFGIWIRENCKGSGRTVEGGLSVTNLDYVLEDFLRKRVMLLEEKQHNGHLGTAQRKTFQILDAALRIASSQLGYSYWGFYVFKMPGTMPGVGMTLNDVPVTQEELVAHLNFERKHCLPVWSPPEDPW